MIDSNKTFCERNRKILHWTNKVLNEWIPKEESTKEKSQHTTIENTTKRLTRWQKIRILPTHIRIGAINTSQSDTQRLRHRWVGQTEYLLCHHTKPQIWRKRRRKKFSSSSFFIHFKSLSILFGLTYIRREKQRKNCLLAETTTLLYVSLGLYNCLG